MEQTSTPATQNSPWRGWTLPSQVSSHPKQISTPATQNSPWRGWAVPSQGVSPRPSLSGTSLQPHPGWGLTSDFPGTPPDAWIGQLHEYSVTSQPQLTTHYHCSFSAMERSLPKFDLGEPYSGKHCSFSSSTETTAFFIKEHGNCAKEQMVQ